MTVVLSKLQMAKLSYARKLCLAGIILYPLAGLALLAFDPHAVEFLSHRIFISIGFVFILLLSYHVDLVKRYALDVALTYSALPLWWSVWITQYNDFRISYCLVLLAGICACSSAILNRTFLAFYLLSMVFFILLFGTLTVDGSNPTAILLFCIVLLGTVVFCVELFQLDIQEQIESLNTELRKNNQDLEAKVTERTKSLKQKHKEMETFAYRISHDLKSPLLNIKSFSSLLEEDFGKGAGETSAEYFRIINKSVDNMAALISELLQYGQVGQQELELQDLCLTGLLREVIEANFQRNVQDGAVIELKENVDAIVRCDPQQMSLLFQNLIGNGLKYNMSKTKWIGISYTASEDFHHLTVADNGIGIDPGYRSEVFKIFHRLHARHEFEGSGVGLATCKTIVEKHGGSIAVDASPYGGSSFEFKIAKEL